MKKIILDCDPGMDDSMAIVMAVKSKELDVKAITTVNGNYPVDITAVNALKVLEMLGRTDIPGCKGNAGAHVSGNSKGSRLPMEKTVRRKISCRILRLLKAKNMPLT